MRPTKKLEGSDISLMTKTIANNFNRTRTYNMLYYLFKYLEESHQFPGASLFGFLTFRAAVAIILSLLISTIFGKRIIRFLQKQQVGETIRDLGLEGQKEKAGTPTMGGVIIILATLIPVLLLAKLDNIYIILFSLPPYGWESLGLLTTISKNLKMIKKV